MPIDDEELVADAELADEDEGEEEGEEEDLPEIVEIPLEDHIDLHGFLPADVKEILRTYLDDAFAAGFDEIRIVHGRGIAVLRELTRTLLARDPRIERFADAERERGGNGATVARFRR